ncbi:hypothetical protein OUZ56_019482 [Daphnia magna]|uniref:Uncharacterized protein n=1 Tax=Daphnia magna TaxID=35525 RepID=A0ABQ9ZBS8_9CRUS|nr:hypothetical protein OUZ56_019482 [Daphnia magna]
MRCSIGLNSRCRKKSVFFRKNCPVTTRMLQRCCLFALSVFRRFRNNAAIVISSYSRETIDATVSTPRSFNGQWVLVIMTNGLRRISTTMAPAAHRLT